MSHQANGTWSLVRPAARQAGVLFPDLSEPERLVCAAFPRGERADFGGRAAAGSPGGGPEIRAEVLRALLLGAGETEAGFTPAVRLRGARITGSLDLPGATVWWPLACEDCVFDAGIRLAESVTKAVRITGCRLPGFDGTRMRLEGILDLSATVVAGAVRLSQARITGQLCLRGTRAGAAPRGQAGAVTADGLTVDGGADCADLAARGTVSLRGATVTGTLDLRGARVSRPAGEAITADNAEFGRVDCRGMAAEGRTSLRGTRIASTLLLTGATLTQQAGQACGTAGGGVACRLSGAVIAGDLIGDGMTVTGGLCLIGTRVTGSIQLDRVTLRNERGEALSANAARAGRFTFRPAAPVQGAVSLSHARIGVLTDDPDRWPAELATGGLTYQCLEPRLPARQRLAWLARDPAGHQPRSCEQLAAYYTSIGEPAQARVVLLARERARRRSLTLLPRAWGVLQDVVAGYGYRPWRAVTWLVVLLAAGTAGYGLFPPPPLVPGHAPHFQPLAYTLDLLLPVADLGQKHAYNPAGPWQWFSYLLVAAGWVLVTTVAAAAARLLARR